MKDSVDFYKAEMASMPLSLTAEEELTLAREFKRNGSVAARNRLIESNLRFVVRIAGQYRALGIPLEDLIQAGNEGLMKGIERFDPERGNRLLTYATWWIRRGIQELLERKRDVRTSRSEYIKNKRGEDGMNTTVVSLNNPEYERMHDEEVSRAVRQRDQFDELGACQTALQVRKALKKSGLTERETNIVKKYFGLDGDEPLTMKDIGIIYELTGSRIEQLLKEALGKMRKRNPALREINTD